MPIYAYKCESCGHSKDVLQKISDAPLTQCPACGAPAFKKQLTAAGFQLKGSGWYVTDFRGGSGAAAPAVSEGKDAAKTESKADAGGAAASGSKAAEAKPAESKSAPSQSTESKPAAAKSDAASPPAGSTPAR
ncbi:MAG: zinc ribbon domain-containing protein [Burkholderiaceae bacterium]|nr:zinc ribbon domain-containing protein [Burkholderiaceae bacterium]MDO9089267.1 zinc ribbon domain-containing protein [Burkholderiaceae bacterium]MDP1969196.1 zinc ribbon domain-containing protein [Burkholderiaceae bacterium]